jgi:hypothetical protein
MPGINEEDGSSITWDDIVLCLWPFALPILIPIGFTWLISLLAEKIIQIKYRRLYERTFDE